jgi:drug/metabolite transporter (DMT)-like permease
MYSLPNADLRGRAGRAKRGLVPEPAAETAQPEPRGLRDPALAGIAWMMAANVLFAGMTMAARLASRSASWSTVGAARAFFGALVAALVAWWTGKSLRTSRPGLSWARSILGTLSMLATFFALGSKTLAVGDALTLFATAPLFIALLAPIVLKERTDRSLWGVLLVAFSGVALVAGPHLSASGLPALAAFLAAVFSAGAMMFLRMMRSGRGGEAPESAEAIAFHFATLGFVVHAIIASFTFQLPAASDWIFLVLAGVSGGLAQLAMTRAYALTQAARLGAISYVGTVIGFVGAVVVLGERPEWSQVAGATLVVGAGVTLAVLSSRSARQEVAPRRLFS